MLLNQIFCHRLSANPLSEDWALESSLSPRKLVSVAIQAHAGLAWRETIIMAAALGRALYELVSAC